MTIKADSYENHLLAVIRDPEIDAPRLEFAAARHAQEPDQERFIQLQVEEAQRRRARGSYAGDNFLGAPQDGALLRQLQLRAAKWAPGPTFAKYTKSYQYDRGFIAKIVIDPDMFLEYGEWLYANAPIRHVGFSRVEQGTFPMNELAASPLLRRLDSLDFTNCDVTDESVTELAKSPNLERLTVLDLSHNARVGLPSFEALAANTSTRRLLCVLRSQRDRVRVPGDRYEATDEYDLEGRSVYGWTAIGREGEALEQTHGYIPWLHPRENDCEPLDAAWYVTNGLRPARPPGSRDASQPPAARP